MTFRCSRSLELIDQRRVWDAGPHCAFTDLVDHAGELFLSFREGRGHLSTEGAARVLRSSDGETWTSSALVRLAGHDLRDPSISVMPDGRLMLIAGVAERLSDGEGSRFGTGTAVCFSDDGVDWSTPEIVIQPGRWVWRATWYEGAAYGFAYGGGGGGTVVSLMRSVDARTWTVHAHEALATGSPSEVSLRIGRDGTALALARRGGEPNTAALGTSRAPFREWTWRDLDVYVGGPCLFDGGDIGWLAAGRIFDGEAPRTQLARIDLQRPGLDHIATLESGGDTSYPGLVRRGNTIFMSYYSTHEEKTCIYLARLQFSD